MHPAFFSCFPHSNNGLGWAESVTNPKSHSQLTCLKAELEFTNSWFRAWCLNHKIKLAKMLLEEQYEHTQ